MLAHKPIAYAISELFLGLCYCLMNIALFLTPPHALLNDIEHMHYACAPVTQLLPHPPPVAFSSYGYLKN
jgi:hypothetical protein